jgi:hypothetical protein
MRQGMAVWIFPERKNLLKKKKKVLAHTKNP